MLLLNVMIIGQLPVTAVFVGARGWLTDLSLPPGGNYGNGIYIGNYPIKINFQKAAPRKVLSFTLTIPKIGSSSYKKFCKQKKHTNLVERWHQISIHNSYEALLQVSKYLLYVFMHLNVKWKFRSEIYFIS